MAGSTFISHLHKPNFDTIINKENPFFGYVSTLERALELVRDFENATTTKFTVFTKTKNFGATGKFNTPLPRSCAPIFKLICRLDGLVRPASNILYSNVQSIAISTFLVFTVR